VIGSTKGGARRRDEGREGGLERFRTWSDMRVTPRAVMSCPPFMVCIANQQNPTTYSPSLSPFTPPSLPPLHNPIHAIVLFHPPPSCRPVDAPPPSMPPSCLPRPSSRPPPDLLLPCRPSSLLFNHRQAKIRCSGEFPWYVSGCFHAFLLKSNGRFTLPPSLPPLSLPPSLATNASPIPSAASFPPLTRPALLLPLPLFCHPPFLFRNFLFLPPMTAAAAAAVTAAAVTAAAAVAVVAPAVFAGSATPTRPPPLPPMRNT